MDEPVGRTTSIPDESLVDLEERVRGAVIRPEDDTYEEARGVWNAMIDERPAVIVRCAGVADVMAALAFARETDLELAVRGGGHSVAGYATCPDGLVVDLSPMNWVTVDPDARVARVGGGATWGDVDHETQAFGLATPGGAVSTTGVAGLTLGGGYGYLRRRYGLTIDNLLEIDLVTADGRFLTANETEHPDLFWAARGGGGNFGVVTAFAYRLHPVGPEVATVTALYSMEDAPTVGRRWRKTVAAMPDAVSAELLFWSVPDVDEFPDDLRTRPVVIAAAVHCGPVEEGERTLRPLRELARPVLDLSGPAPYTVLQQSFDPFLEPGALRFYMKSLFLDDLDDGALDAIVARARSRPDDHVLIDVWQMGGAVARVPEDATAYSGRSEPYLLSIDAAWAETEDDERVIGWARSFWDEMHAFSSGGMYLNFPGLGEEREALLRATHGPEKYDRLVDVKTRYDPTNRFRRNQNVVPREPTSTPTREAR